MEYETEYEKWKASENTYKFPWVIKYYKSITDVNQYKLGSVVQEKAVLLMSVVFFCLGVIFGSLLMSLWLGNI